MKRLLCSIILLATSISASAVDTSNLTSAQIAKLQADASAIAAQNMAAKENGGLNAVIQNPEEAVSLMSTWGVQTAAAAKGFAEALGVAAHELNIGANEFLDTPAGKLTAGIIIWKVMGEAILSLIGGVCIILFTFFLGRWLMLRVFTDGFTPTENIWFWGLLKTTKYSRTYKNIKDLKDQDDSWFLFFLGLVIMGAGFVVGIIIAL